MMVGALAFLRRDLLIAWSYRFQFFAQLGSMVTTMLVFFFLGKLITPQQAPQLVAYGGDYFAFSLVGLAFADYLMLSVNGFASEIRKGQLEGTFEALLTAPIPSLGILLYASLSSFLFTTLRIVLYLAVGVLFFQMHWNLQSPGLLLFIFLLMVCAFWGIGLISATFVLLFKQTSPITWLFGPVSGLLGGVMFPVELLPGWLKWIAELLPITWSLGALRKILLNGATLTDLYLDCCVLIIFAILFLVLGIKVFRKGLQHAQKEGSLVHY